jgi:hypothetical protein
MRGSEVATAQGPGGGDGVTRLYLGRHSASSAVGLRRVECPIPRANF